MHMLFTMLNYKSIFILFNITSHLNFMCVGKKKKSQRKNAVVIDSFLNGVVFKLRSDK